MFSIQHSTILYLASLAGKKLATSDRAKAIASSALFLRGCFNFLQPRTLFVLSSCILSLSGDNVICPRNVLNERNARVGDFLFERVNRIHEGSEGSL